MPIKSPSPQTSTLVLHFQGGWTSLLAAVVELAVVVWYVRATKKVTAEGRRWSPLRTASFVTGMVGVAYLVEGGLAIYERSNFTAHVVQLLLLAYIAGPLLTFGAPLRLALWSTSRGPNAVLVRALHSSPARLLTQPLVALALATAVMYAYMLTPLYGASERHPSSLVLVDLAFLLAGGLLWWVVAAQDALPKPPGYGLRFVVVFALAPVDAYLGLAVASLTKPLYPAGNTLADTHVGGSMFWGLAEVLIVLALALLFVDWAREEERKAQRADRQLDAALAAARSGAFPARPDSNGA